MAKKQNMSGLVPWLIPLVKDGLNQEQVYKTYLADENISKSYSESSVKRAYRTVKEVLTKAEMLITEDLDRATRLLSKIEKENDLEIAIKSYDIKDVDGLRDWANLPPDKWECYGQTVRASQNKNCPWFIVEGKFRPRTVETITIEEMAEHAESIIKSYKPQKLPTSKALPGNHLLEISLPDVHLGNMNYNDTDTLETVSGRFVGAVQDFIHRTDKIDLDEIIITFGSDYFTINADKPETKKGTPQDINAYYDKIYAVGAKVAIDTISYLRGKARKIVVIGLPGNHDEQSTVWLMICLKHYFDSAADVVVDWTYGHRKYYRFGCTAFAFTHKLRKKVESLPLLMMQEMIDQGLIDEEIKYYEIHGGDAHIPHKQELPAESTNQKITQRVLSSLTDNSRWAHDNFGKKVIEGQAFLYSRDKGILDCMIYRP